MKKSRSMFVAALVSMVLSGCISVSEHPDGFSGLRHKADLADFVGTFSNFGEVGDGVPLSLSDFLFPEDQNVGSITRVVVVKVSETELRIDGVRLPPWKGLSNPLVSRVFVQGVDFEKKPDRLVLKSDTKAIEQMGAGYERSALALGLDLEGNLILVQSESGAVLIGLVVPVAGSEKRYARFRKTEANQALQTTSVTRSGIGKVPVSDRQRRGV